MTARVRLYRPDDEFGRLICWRLESCWSHATIEFDGTIYSATAPRIVAVPLDDTSFGMPPRSGETFEVRLSDAEAAGALAYCRSMVGDGYDILAMLGWAFRVRGLQSRDRVYCFELVYDALAAAGVFPTSKRLLTGDQLLVDLFEAGRVERVPDGTHAHAAVQRQPVTVESPRSAA